jgi:hypothetical protein
MKSSTVKEILVIVGALALFEFLIRPVATKMLAGVPPGQVTK